MFCTTIVNKTSREQPTICYKITRTAASTGFLAFWTIIKQFDAVSPLFYAVACCQDIIFTENNMISHFCVVTKNDHPMNVVVLKAVIWAIKLRKCVLKLVFCCFRLFRPQYTISFSLGIWFQNWNNVFFTPYALNTPM